MWSDDVSKIVIVNHKYSDNFPGIEIEAWNVSINMMLQDDGKTLKLIYRDRVEVIPRNALLRCILEDVKVLNSIEAMSTDDYYSDWDGSLEFSGIKRVVYSLWHEGYNELGENMMDWMDDTAKDYYVEMIQKYSIYSEIEVKLEED